MANTINKRTKITLTATPKEGYRFISWSNGITDNPYTTTVGNIIGQENRIEPVYALEDSSVIPIGDCASNEIKYITHSGYTEDGADYKLKINYVSDYDFCSKIISHQFDSSTGRGSILFSEDVKYFPNYFISQYNSPDIIQLKFPDCTEFIGLFYNRFTINLLYAMHPELKIGYQDVLSNTTSGSYMNRSQYINRKFGGNNMNNLIPCRCICCNSNSLLNFWKFVDMECINFRLSSLQNTLTSLQEEFETYSHYPESEHYRYLQQLINETQTEIIGLNDTLENYDNLLWEIPVNPYIYDGYAYLDETMQYPICQVDISNTDQESQSGSGIDSGSGSGQTEQEISDELMEHVENNIETETAGGIIEYEYYEQINS